MRAGTRCLGQWKRPDEREFCLHTAVRERWSSRELERQIKGAWFERTVPHPPKASQAIQKNHAAALSVFKDAYLVEFLNLPAEDAESDLHRGLLRGQRVEDHLVDVTELIEIGKGRQGPVQTVMMSRYACYLAIQNADPAREIVAVGQTYFAVQTRRQELTDAEPEDQRRLARAVAQWRQNLPRPSAPSRPGSQYSSPGSMIRAETWPVDRAL